MAENAAKRATSSADQNNSSEDKQLTPEARAALLRLARAREDLLATTGRVRENCQNRREALARALAEARENESDGGASPGPRHF